ncbi:hypothetical protein AB4Y36_38190 [Paraburkholderia sp. BR10936]|uniref:DUF3846 domain-containing protein n=1 Tax=Paraburkholderia sp. BR10936 TaxID=3236993 RepID=UPI0034D19FFE
MFAYLIDPFARTVTRVERSAQSAVAVLQEIYALLDCETIDAVRPVNASDDVIYIDDEGKMHDEREQAYFLCRLWPLDVLAGRALWVGSEPDGSECDPRSALEYVRDHIVWAEPRAAAMLMSID